MGNINPNAQISMDLFNEVLAIHQKLEVLESVVSLSTDSVAAHTILLSTPHSNFVAHMTSMVSPSSTYVIDSRAMDQTTSKRSEFGSYRPSVHGSIRVADGNQSQVMCKGSVNVSSNLSLSSVLYVPESAHNLVLVSSLTGLAIAISIILRFLRLKDRADDWRWL